jgi:hypothetical protein
MAISGWKGMVVWLDVEQRLKLNVVTVKGMNAETSSKLETAHGQ